MATGDERGYNGWPNYETWAVKLHIGNSQGSEEYWSERARECWRDVGQPDESSNHIDRPHRAACALADALKDEHDSGNPFSGDDVPKGLEHYACSVYSDLLSAALSEVRWYTIATHYIDDLDADESADDDDTPDAPDDDEWTEERAAPYFDDRHLLPVVEFTDYHEVEGPDGVAIVPADQVPGSPEADPPGAEGRLYLVGPLKSGWLARMSAPGYMDSTDWSAHDSESDAWEYLVDYHSTRDPEAEDDDEQG